LIREKSYAYPGTDGRLLKNQRVKRIGREKTKQEGRPEGRVKQHMVRHSKRKGPTTGEVEAVKRDRTILRSRKKKKLQCYSPGNWPRRNSKQCKTKNKTGKPIGLLANQGGPAVQDRTSRSLCRAAQGRRTQPFRCRGKRKKTRRKKEKTSFSPKKI